MDDEPVTRMPVDRAACERHVKRIADGAVGFCGECNQGPCPHLTAPEPVVTDAMVEAALDVFQGNTWRASPHAINQRQDMRTALVAALKAAP